VGGVDRLVQLADADIEPSSLRSAAPALSAAARVAERLRPLASAERASVHLQRLIDFLNGLTPTPTADGSVAARLERGRRAVMGTLASLASAYAAHDDAVVSIEDVISRVRRAIEAQTFVADDPDEDGAVRLMDDHAARYAQADELAVVGLIDGEWPERPIRNIFFPTSLIAALGWPTERDRRAASEARFLDLLGSATKSVTVSTVKLDDEAIVEPSPFVDEIVRAGLSVIEPADADGAPDAYADAAPDSDWAALRRSAPARDMPAFHGQTVATDPRAWSVSALETYLGCPFKFFAQHVLALDEDPEDEEILDPRRQGELVHRVFEDFFREWQDAGRGAITPDSLGDARALFASIVEREVAALPEAEAALERTRLLGSPVAAGLGEAVFLMEAERPMPVVDRLLEWTLTGTFRVSVDGADRDVRLRGKADRVDLLADGTFRVIDYKLGRAPNRTRALQLPVYGLCAEQQLQRERGRLWTLSEAAYIAFREPKRVVPLFSSHEEKAEVLASAQQRLIGTLDRIAAGEFPPTPDDVFRCETCAFASVCRKDYVGDV
jgi:RecB family exonuclease